MPWFAWLTIGSLITCIIVLIVVLLRKKSTVIRGLTDEERQLLAKIEQEQIKKAAELDAYKIVRLEEIAKIQKDKLQKLEMAYHATKKFIGATKQEEFESYLTDANRAGTELDRILGLGTRDNINSSNRSDKED